MARLDKETKEKALQALDRQKKQYSRQNDFIKNNYDRISVTLPKGTKDRITQLGETANGLINRLLLEYLDNQ